MKKKHCKTPQKGLNQHSFECIQGHVVLIVGLALCNPDDLKCPRYMGSVFSYYVNKMALGHAL